MLKNTDLCSRLPQFSEKRVLDRNQHAIILHRSQSGASITGPLSSLCVLKTIMWQSTLAGPKFLIQRSGTDRATL